MASTRQPPAFEGRRLSKLLEELAREIHEALLALNREIGAYPPPIPACDAQFNFLLDKRRRLSQENREIQRLINQSEQKGVAHSDLEALAARLGRQDEALVGRLRAFLNVPR